MAFVTRSFRDTSLSKKHSATTDQIGPGKYGPGKNGKFSVSYAPFASSSERKTSQNVKQLMTPGPADYKINKLAQRSSSASSPTFMSRVSRFAEDSKRAVVDSGAPGPGSYKQSNSWLKGQAHPRKQRKASAAVSWMRASNAPSIPAAGQSYGYEESKDGDLILQKPPKRGFAGEKGDTVGVGQYKPFRKFGSSTQGKDFCSSKMKRLHEETSKYNVAPGQYNPSDIFEQKLKKKENMVFKSKTTRLPKAKLKDTPGPGKYERTSVFASTEVPKDYQFFGSSSTKSAQLFNGAPGLPGPGTYAREVIEADTEDREYKGGFSTKEARWQVKKKEPTPGPGKYIKQPNISEELSKKVFGRNTSFGNTMKRFQMPKDTGKTGPGPGHYTEKKLVQPVLQSSVFLSEKERFKKGVGPMGPSPASYDPFVANGMNKDPERPSQAFGVESRRAAKNKISKHGTRHLATVGPGSYDPPRAYEKTNMKRFSDPTTGQFRSMVQREFVSPSKLPGPGTYENNASFVKRSYNITVGS